jgi:hypothetical protein
MATPIRDHASKPLTYEHLLRRDTPPALAQAHQRPKLGRGSTFGPNSGRPGDSGAGRSGTRELRTGEIAPTEAQVSRRRGAAADAT